MSARGWPDALVSCVFSEPPPPLVKSARCVFLMRYVLLPWSLEVTVWLLRFRFQLPALLGVLVQRRGTKWGLWQTCQGETNDVWEKIRDRGCERAAR